MGEEEQGDHANETYCFRCSARQRNTQSYSAHSHNNWFSAVKLVNVPILHSIAFYVKLIFMKCQFHYSRYSASETLHVAVHHSVNCNNSGIGILWVRYKHLKQQQYLQCRVLFCSSGLHCYKTKVLFIYLACTWEFSSLLKQSSTFPRSDTKRLMLLDGPLKSCISLPRRTSAWVLDSLWAPSFFKNEKFCTISRYILITEWHSKSSSYFTF